MPFTGPQQDRHAIRDLYDSYADGANLGDIEAWLACWSEDASWWTHYFEVTGKAAIRAQYMALMGNVESTSFFTQIGSIEVDGSRAKARAFCLERLVMKTGGSHRLTGRYEDELVRVDGQWQFARRVFKVMIEEFPEG
jgi:uncharacterized protein (TIGR02246 family)